MFKKLIGKLLGSQEDAPNTLDITKGSVYTPLIDQSHFPMAYGLVKRALRYSDEVNKRSSEAGYLGTPELPNFNHDFDQIRSAAVIVVNILSAKSMEDAGIKIWDFSEIAL